MANVVVAPAFYLPPIPMWALLAEGGTLILDPHMHFEKQSFFNHAHILQSSGPQVLTIPVHRKGRSRTPLKQVRIDFSHAWVHRHRLSFQASYRAAPFFEFYEAEFLAFFRQVPDFLYEWNWQWIHWLVKQLGLPVQIQEAESFQRQYPDEVIDLRWQWLPHRRLLQLRHPQMPTYHQHFMEQTGFVPNLSVVDLLFNRGPHAEEYLHDYLDFLRVTPDFAQQLLGRPLPRQGSVPLPNHSTKILS